jgi:transcriptional regulator GlxA family with amidase domain
VIEMNAVYPLSGSSHVEPVSSAALARLLADAVEGLDCDLDRVRASLSRAVALVDGASILVGAMRRGGLAAWQARKISDLVEANLECGVRISELAASTRLSKSHFSRAFRAHFGRSPQQYILERRVARAQQLMLASECRLCDVAQACGFADQAHLSRMFRRLVGAAPSAWRRARFDPQPSGAQSLA